MSSLRSQHVRSIMAPWTRVRRLTTAMSRQIVLKNVAAERFSRWPVTDPRTGKAVGYLLSKDLIAEASTDGDWTSLVRPIRSVHPGDDIESTLMHLQSEGATICVVEDAGAPVGLITLEDILEQVVGRIEDEYPHEPALSLRDAVTAGGVILQLQGQTLESVIAELAAEISPDDLPAQAKIGELALTREQEVSTDLGVGVAIPHARCPNLRNPLIVFGRSPEGVEFSPVSAEPVRLVFLLVTPLEQPDLQLSLLAQLARLAGNPSARERLRQASSEADVMEIIAEEHSPPGSAESATEQASHK